MIESNHDDDDDENNDNETTTVNKKMIYQTKIQQLFVTIGMLDEFYQTLVSLWSFFNSSHTQYSTFNLQYDSTI